MKPDQQHFSIWFLASGPCGSIKMTYHDFTAANKHNMMILNTHSSSQGSWATTYLRYRRNKFIFWRSILRGSVTWVLRACSLFLVMCTSSTSVVNGKNCIQEWTPKDTYRNEIGIRPWNTSMPWSQYDLIRLGDPLVSVQFSQDSLYLLECQVFVRQSTQSCLNIIHFLRLCGSTVCIPQRRPSLYLGPSDFVWFLATRLNVSSKKQK